MDQLISGITDSSSGATLQDPQTVSSSDGCNKVYQDQTFFSIPGTGTRVAKSYIFFWERKVLYP